MWTVIDDTPGPHSYNALFTGVYNGHSPIHILIYAHTGSRTAAGQDANISTATPIISFVVTSIRPHKVTTSNHKIRAMTITSITLSYCLCFDKPTAVLDDKIDIEP